MERAPDFIAALKEQVQPSPQLAGHFDEIRRRFPADENGVPKIPHLTAEQTQNYLQRCVRTDASMRDAGARGADVAARSIAKGRASQFSGDWDALKALPTTLNQLTIPNVPHPSAPPQAFKAYQESLTGVGRTAGKLYADLGRAVDEHAGAYERSMGGPTDAQRTRAGNEAMATFHESQAARDPRITFGMAQLMSAQEQREFCALDDRFKAVERVNRFLDYGRGGDRAAERGDLKLAQANTLATVPAGLDDFYASSRHGTISDGFEQKAQARHDLAAVDRALTTIQQRDGIANDGSFALPMLSKEQSKEWLERCERMDSALSRATQGFPPKGKAPKASSIDRVQADLTQAAGLPKTLAALEKSGLSPEQRHVEVDRLLSQSKAMDANTQAFEKSIAVPEKSKSLWQRLRGAIRSLRPSPAAPQTSIQPTSGEPVRSLDGASYKTVSSLGLEGEVAARAAAKRAQTPPQPPAKQPSLEERIMVSSGEVGHEASKGSGFTAMGKVEGVKHVGDAVEVDYAVLGHHFDVKIEQKDAAGHALAHAAEELKAGDSFKISIGHDRDGKDVAHLDDRTTGQSVTVDHSGHVENGHTADLTRSRPNTLGR